MTTLQSQRYESRRYESRSPAPVDEQASPRRLPGPPLQNGDHLTRAEFERRYEAMPAVKKAELIEGRVYVPSPARHRSHAQPHALVVGWLFIYSAATPGVQVGDNGSVRLDLDNEPQPDAFLIIEPEHGGQARLDADDYVEGPPELVVEVAASSASYDLHEKLHVYRRNGVREYLVWRVLEEALDWLSLREGRYEPLQPAEDGSLRSEVFPGLWLDPAALLAGNLPRVAEVLRQGLAAPEHAAFVASIQQAKSK